MTIETPRLLLRPFTPADAQAIFSYLHAPEMRCFADMALETMADAEAAALQRSRSATPYFAITEKATGAVIGELFARGRSTDPTDSVRDSYFPCWMLHPAHQGKGYMTEAVRAFFDYLFSLPDCRRIYLYTEDYNLPCRRLCEKLGMRLEGVFPEFVSFVNGPDGQPLYETSCQYAILKKEWLAR